MAIPNLIALLALSGVVVRETEKYFDHLKTGKDYEEYEDLDPSLASAKAQPEVEE
jgi:AGCS family alanine or glycine:cation symporter